ncbi:MAG TPA: YheC/YheD family protein [Firmicutes bacterium]|nr:YheC/YheD family protein [Bacillota bacterium]
MIGILVDKMTIVKTRRGEPTYERLDLYRDIALSEGIELIVFSLGRVSLRRHRVTGYIPLAGPEDWQRETVSIPKVIHKRVLYQTSAPFRILRRLERRGVVFVNPYLIQNKMLMNSTLSRHPSINPHIPTTWRYNWLRLEKMLHRGEAVILKPTVGSVGQGIIRLLPLAAANGNGGQNGWSAAVQITTERGSRIITSPTLLRRYLRAWMKTMSRKYLMQPYLPLARYQDKPFDLRVPVQRDGRGEWTVAGMVAKVAEKHQFLTNLAQGGRAMPGEKALAAAFGPPAAEAVQEKIVRLAKDVAEAVAGRYPHAADLGLDIGVDITGHPWLIEVNTRDQRITFFQAGMYDTLRTIYKNPVAYCAYLSSRLTTS